MLLVRDVSTNNDRLRVQCLACARLVILADAAIDLDGPAYAAYYHNTPECRPDGATGPLPAAQDAATARNAVSWPVTGAQVLTLRQKFDQERGTAESFAEFVALFRPFGIGIREGQPSTIGGAWAGMFLGIEPDGYAHT